MQKLPKAILFDFDGVIVDSTPSHLNAWAKAYHLMFQKTLEEEDLRALMGRSTAAIGRILAEKSGFPGAKQPLIRHKQEFVHASLDQIELIVGIKDFLAHLRRRDIPFGIVSNAPRNFIGETLRAQGLSFPFYLGLEDYFRPKPDAEPFVKGAKRCGLIFTDHPEIWVFEDSTHGIEAALAAHMKAFGICSQHPPEILHQAGAQRSFVDFTEALTLLD